MVPGIELVAMMRRFFFAWIGSPLSLLTQLILMVFVIWLARFLDVRNTKATESMCWQSQISKQLLPVRSPAYTY